MKVTWEHFASTTTVGGLAQLHNAPHLVLKAIWLIIFLTFTGLTCYNSYTVFLDYFNYPVLTYVSVSYERRVQFPAVTVCNLNPMPCSNMALAYMEDPSAFARVYHLSKCNTTIGRQPLIYKLITPKASQYLVRTLRQALIQKILSAQNNQNTQPTATSQQPGPPPPSSTPVLSNATLQNWTTIQLINEFIPKPVKQQEQSVQVLNEAVLEDIVRQIMDTYSQGVNITKPVASTPSNSTSTSSAGANNTTSPPPPPGPAGLGPRDIANAKEDFITAEAFLKELVEMHRSTMSKVVNEAALNMNQMVMECTFQGTDCMNDSLFIGTPDPGYGRCFTFNTAFNPLDDFGGERVVGMTGKQYGLTLDLFLGQADYLPSSLAASEGIRITVHDPSQRPNPGDEGISVRPNAETDIALKMLKVSRLGSPYQSQCVADWNGTPFMPKETMSGVSESYSYGACQDMCESVHILEECSCMDPHSYKQFSYNGVLLGIKERLCRIVKDDPTDFNCMKIVRAKLQEGQLECDCHLPCEDSVYESHTSSAVWPAKGYLSTIAASYMGRYANIAPAEVKVSREKMESIVQAEFARVNIYFRTLNLQTVEEQAKYDVWGFLSSLGGAVGLYLGMCGISLIEILEVCILLALAGICKIKVVQSGEEEPRVPKTVPKSAIDESNQEVDKKTLFRMTHSAELMRQQHVYPIKVPEPGQNSDANHTGQQKQKADLNLRALYNF